MTKLSWWRRMIGRWAAGTRRAAFAASNVNERNVTAGIDWTALYRDRYNYDRDQVLEQALLAWRLNPLAAASSTCKISTSSTASSSTATTRRPSPSCASSGTTPSTTS